MCSPPPAVEPFLAALGSPRKAPWDLWGLFRGRPILLSDLELSWQGLRPRALNTDSIPVLPYLLSPPNILKLKSLMLGGMRNSQASAAVDPKNILIKLEGRWRGGGMDKEAVERLARRWELRWARGGSSPRLGTRGTHSPDKRACVHACRHV